MSGSTTDSAPENEYSGSPETVEPSAQEPSAQTEEEKVAAVRRVSEAGRRWRAAQLAGCAALLAVALTGGSIAFGALRDGGAATVASSSSAVSPGLMASGDLDAGISAIQ